jgi:AAA15 family ATPase/GTPase
MNDHFIKNIEIKNFKCFEDFKAEGFGRVNLIGGKNNVGKTAFMEACFLSSLDIKSKEFINRSIIIELHRNSLDFLLLWLSDFTEFTLKYKNKKIYVNQKKLDEHKSSNFSVNWNDVVTKYSSFSEYLVSFYKKGLPPLITNISFISVNSSFNNNLVYLIDEMKLANKDKNLNIALNDFFQIDKIDVIRNKVMLKKDSKYLLLSEFGDGVKHFLNIILALYLNKDSILYLDELENGIHYTNLDKLWEIILTISKEQNVQVFATTHSKECIESYARVAKKLEDEEITFIELGKNKDSEIKAMVYHYDWFMDEIEQNHEVRGW